MKTYWRHGPQDLSSLQSLGILATRLIRLLAFQKIRRGEAQLRSQGFPVDLTSAYAAYTKISSEPLIPLKPENFVRFVENKASEF